MHTVESALAEIVGHARALPRVASALESARDHVLAEPIRADIDLPPFDKALVDGYAVHAAACGAGEPVELEILEVVDAGRVPQRPLRHGQTSLVMTGAPLPEGADAVVMHEQTQRLSETRVRLHGPVKPGQNRLTRGREARAGSVVLERGVRLGPAQLGLAASVGSSQVQVIDRPRVTIVPTGDELVPLNQVPGPGQIRNANGLMLAALVHSLGFEARHLAPVADHVESLRSTFRNALSSMDAMAADVLIVSGGVSAGRLDLVPRALCDVGVRPIFHRVRVRPGKPLWFGLGPERVDRGPCLVFGLPGNPVSGIVSTLLFVHPALQVLSGLPPRSAANPRMPLDVAFSHRGERPTYHPARVIDGKRLVPLDWAGSADLSTVAKTDGFAVFPAGDADYPVGTLIEYLAWPST